MKISYRTHPILKSIETGNLNDKFEYAEILDPRMMRSHYDILNTWNEYHKDFMKERYLFTKPLLEAFINNSQKLNKIIDETESFLFSGTYIQNKTVHCFASRSYEDFCYFIFQGNKLHFYVKKSEKGILQSPFVSKFSSSFFPYSNLYEIIINITDVMIRQRKALNIIPIETKIINKNSKALVNREKIVNDLGFDVTIIDSTWFTNIIHDKEFNVRGHFRLQPIGPGREQRKLIWVNDFKKNGYVRQAKKLKYE